MLYVDAGQVVTSAGTAAGLDAALHIWRQEYGAAVASTVARRMVVPPQRDGGQAQFITRPVVDCQAETLGPLLTWIAENLDGDLSVEALAALSDLLLGRNVKRGRHELPEDLVQSFEELAVRRRSADPEETGLLQCLLYRSREVRSTARSSEMGFTSTTSLAGTSARLRSRGVTSACVSAS